MNVMIAAAVPAVRFRPEDELARAEFRELAGLEEDVEGSPDEGFRTVWS